MSQSRFVFVRGTWLRGVPVPAWPGPDEPAAGVTDGRWTSWRLLGGNNYELGRGAVLFADDESCAAAVQRLRGLDIRGGATVQVRGDGWRWRVDVAGDRTAVSARGYLRQRECQYNLDQFLAEAPQATPPVPGDPRPGRGRRRSRHDRNLGPDGPDPAVAGGRTCVAATSRVGLTAASATRAG